MFNKNELYCGKCTKREYYQQFVDVDVLEVVLTYVGEAAIMQADEDFKNISDDDWVRRTHAKIVKLKEPQIVAAIDYITPWTTMHIAKEAARIVRESLTTTGG
jgi:hypothetical protein